MKVLVNLAVCLILSSGAIAHNGETTDIHETSDLNLTPYKEVFGLNRQFTDYIKNAEEELAANEKRIASLLTKLAGDKAKGLKKDKKVIIRQERRIIILKRSNSELAADLENYINYGIGDWHLFKIEFNAELAELNYDLSRLRLVIFEDFLADNDN